MTNVYVRYLWNTLQRIHPANPARTTTTTFKVVTWIVTWIACKYLCAIEGTKIYLPEKLIWTWTFSPKIRPTAKYNVLSWMMRKYLPPMTERNSLTALGVETNTITIILISPDMVVGTVEMHSQVVPVHSHSGAKKSQCWVEAEWTSLVSS